MKIYTRTGDGGETSLYGGQRVGKDALRVKTLGTVDECNAALGVALAQIPDPEVRGVLTRIQGEMFEVGADLATPLARGETVPRVRAEETAQLEAEIDRFEGELEPLRHFILPGGSPGGAALHLARAICRRAERHLVTLAQAEQINAEAARYLNRLSDHLFVSARLVNHRAGMPEVIWERPEHPSS
ncbi:MAG: cob(I)yrinic acid a,c-diamide adenosyltransferase [Armatimonadetes bacterium]|nr:cob(I)yrinic acid a,c-diamide adenosyltransferase [Armatimonadota bacterium]